MFENFKRLVFVTAILIPHIAQAQIEPIRKQNNIEILNAKIIERKNETATIIKYHDEGKTYEQWYKEFKETNELISRQIQKVEDEYPEQMMNDINFRSKVSSRLAERRLIDLWNTKIVNNPDSKNARSAFCSYGKDMGPLINPAIICDKDFELKPNHMRFEKEMTIKSVSKNK